MENSLSPTEDRTISQPTEPPSWIIQRAIDNAQKSPCHKSRRGVVIYATSIRHLRSLSFNVLGDGFNGPPAPFRCGQDDACRAHCRELCEHAELRAIHDWLAHRHALPDQQVDLVHVKVDAAGKLVRSGGPSCHRCSRTILDVGVVHHVWLYTGKPPATCPQVNAPRVECAYCQGQDCLTCRCAEPSDAACHHDVVARHADLPVVTASWRRYAAQEFHELSLLANELPTFHA